MTTLTVLPSACHQGNGQRCLVGPAVFEQLDVPLGSWCVVYHHANRSICSLWPRRDLQDGFIEIPDDVTIPGPSEEPRFGRTSDVLLSVEAIRPVPDPPTCQRVTLSVVAEFEHLRSVRQAPREAVARHLRYRLTGCGVAEGCIVKVQPGDRHSGPRVSHVVVEECVSLGASPSGAPARDGRGGGSSPRTSAEERGLVVEADSEPAPLDGQEGVEAEAPIPSPVGDDSRGLDCEKSDGAGLMERETHPKVCLIGEKTEIRIRQIASRESVLPADARPVPRVGGLDEAVALLKRLIQYPARYPETLAKLGLGGPHAILLRGPPGCGKTSLMKAVAAECKVCLLQINGAEVFGASPGESEANLRRVFDRAAALLGESRHDRRVVLFLDELDALCPRRSQAGAGEGSQEARVTAQLLTLMGGGVAGRGAGRAGVLVVGATSRPNALDPALRRPGRFDQEVLVGMPSRSQRANILEVHCRGLRLAEGVDLEELAGRCHGYNGADLACLCQQAALMALDRETGGGGGDGGRREVDEPPVVTMSDFIGCLSHVTPSLHRAAGSVVKELQPVAWEAIGGLRKVKAQLRQAVEWPLNHWPSFARLGVRGPSGVLLYGPPGCCKTTLAQAAATACRASFYALSCAELYSPFVGDSEKVLAEVFRKARLTSPSIVFLDELDSLIGGRGTEQGRGLSERLLSGLLVEMDGIGVLPDEEIPTDADASIRPEGKVLVVAASNRLDLIDAALLRPGRFDCLIYVPPPDTEARREILSVYANRMPLADGVDLDHIAEVTDLYTGADLEGLCREAGLMSLQEHGIDAAEVGQVHQRHLLAAMQWCAPSLTPDLLAKYRQTGIPGAS